jgi:sodium/bile acid cotransporter 7
LCRRARAAASVLRPCGIEGTERVRDLSPTHNFSAAAVVRADAADSPSSSLLSSLASFATTNFLPLSLVAGCTAGTLAPAAGCAAGAAGASTAATAGIFLIAGLSLAPADAARAAASKRAVAAGLASILVLTPLLAAPLAHALRSSLHPHDLATGLTVFFCLPTTLSSGVAITAAAGGDAALALLLTVASNLMGVLTAPIAIGAVLGSGGSGARFALDPGPLLASLASSVAAPLAAGAALRALLPPLATAVDARKRTLRYVSATLLALVPWIQTSRAAAAGCALPPSAVAAAVGAGVALHAGLLVVNGFLATRLPLGPSPDDGHATPPAAALALTLVASQKTLTIAPVALLALYASPGGPPGGAGAAAVASLPLVGVHVLQTALDGALAARWGKRIAGTG